VHALIFFAVLLAWAAAALLLWASDHPGNDEREVPAPPEPVADLDPITEPGELIAAA
jgi:hypothetical protein